MADLIEKAYELGFKYEKEYRGCAPMHNCGGPGHL